MPDALFVTWGQPVRGREKRANDQLRDSIRYWRQLQHEGRIAHFDWGALAPQGGALWGFAVLRGTAEQLDALRRTAEFGIWVTRLCLVAEQVSVVDATVDEELLAQQMDGYDETLRAFESEST